MLALLWRGSTLVKKRWRGIGRYSMRFQGERLKMFELIRSSGGKKVFFFILIFLLATNLSILLNIPVLRQVLGFAFFTIIPGLLILYILKLNRVDLTEKFVLSVGLSIAFLMFAGLFINTIFPLFGYDRPLTTDSLLISFSVIILLLVVIAYLRNRGNSFVRLSDFKLNTREKACLLLPILLPLLSILGMRIMNTTDNNAMLMVLLFLIPAYVVFIGVKHKQVPDRVYAPIILLTSISLVLLTGLRSSYIIGVDAHMEYYLFRQTLYNGLWQIGLMGNPLDAVLSVSILPTIYHSFLNTDSQYLFKLLYPLIFSISPVIAYLISKKYIGNRYAFLASFFFMSQIMFLWITAHPRSSLAILFFALAIMVLLQSNLGELNKKLLFIVFAFSCILSHYSTAYIFFFILLFTWLGMQIIPRLISLQRTPTLLSNPSTGGNPPNATGQATATTLEMCQPLLRNPVTFGMVTIFFALIFFWYSQVTGPAFDAGVAFVSTTLESLPDFFILEAREGGGVSEAFGYGLGYKDIPMQIRFVFSWLTIAFIGIGVLATLARYRPMVSFPGNKEKLPSELSSKKIDPLFLILALVCSAIMAAAVAIPFVFVGYGMDRAYMQMIVVLSPFFVIGGIEIARFLRAKQTHLVILIVLIPFFMCQTGTMHEIFGVAQSLAMNSEGRAFDLMYVHKQESYAARWLKNNADEEARIYTDFFGGHWLSSQGMIRSGIYDPSFIEDKEAIGDGYIFLRHVNVVGGKLLSNKVEWHNLTEYDHLFIYRNKIYDNGGSQVWR
ncbi:DUF2206 domain-containing protein [Dehalococcoidia bacterium]|nr:DUF2206 domain-containing protein [Dehalococcoidia bacterium]